MESIPKVFESEYRFLLILWELEPVKSSELVRRCEAALGWKPTTTYTVIKRLSERGILKNEQSVVRALVTKDAVQQAEIDELVSKKFDGSIPSFVAAFAEKSRLKQSDIDALQQMIDRARRECTE